MSSNHRVQHPPPDMSKEQQLKYMNMRWQQMASEQTMDYLQRMSPEQQKWFLGPLSTSQAGASDPAEQEVQEDSLSAVIRRLSIAERELEMEQMRVLYIGHYVKVLYILLGIPCVTIACTSPIVVFAPKMSTDAKAGLLWMSFIAHIFIAVFSLGWAIRLSGPGGGGVSDSVWRRS